MLVKVLAIEYSHTGICEHSLLPKRVTSLAKSAQLKSKGLEVKHVILRHGLTEKEAFEVEAALSNILRA